MLNVEVIISGEITQKCILKLRLRARFKIITIFKKMIKNSSGQSVGK